jgi:hypothetical protein
VALCQKLLTRQKMVVHLFLALAVSIRWRLLFPTLCWSTNTKSMDFDTYACKTNLIPMQTCFKINQINKQRHDSVNTATLIHLSYTKQFDACIFVTDGPDRQLVPFDRGLQCIHNCEYAPSLIREIELCVQ